jgi:predicted permease
MLLLGTIINGSRLLQLLTSSVRVLFGSRTGLAVALVLLVMGGASVANLARAAGGLIYACVTTTNGAIRIVSPTAGCLSTG